MKRLIGLILLICVGPVGAAGVHVDDIEYQDWLNELVPHFTDMIRAIELGKNAADETDTVDPETTTEAFCDLLFPTQGATTCDTAGELHYDITDSLQSLSNRVTQMYNCATDGPCAAAPRLTGLRKHTNETLRVELETVKYQQMFDTMVNTARTLLGTLLEAEITNELVDQVEGVKTAAQLCAQFFPGSEADCVVGGGDDREINRTQDLIDASGALDELYDCATNVACGTGDRLSELRQFVEI